MKTERKSVIIGVTAVLLLLVVVIANIVIINNRNQIEQLNHKNVELNTTIEQRDSLVNDLASMFDEIEQNLTFIRDRRGNMVIAPQEGVKNQKEVLVADIKLMNEMLEESSKKIEELDKKLKTSGIEIKSYRNKIAQLNKSIEEQNNSILQLTAEIEKRDYKIADMDKTIVRLQDDIAMRDDSIESKSQVIVQKSQTIVERENEINKAYFTAGSHNELIKKGILTKEGGFLGIGKNTAIRDDLNEGYFTQLDIRNANQFPLNAKKVKLISEHPNNSYRLVEENNKIAYLEIENPKEFWKLTKYVIVETRN